jgi:hypothetical protein
VHVFSHFTRFPPSSRSGHSFGHRSEGAEAPLVINPVRNALGLVRSSTRFVKLACACQRGNHTAQRPGACFGILNSIRHAPRFFPITYLGKYQGHRTECASTRSNVRNIVRKGLRLLPSAVPRQRFRHGAQGLSMRLMLVDIPRNAARLIRLPNRRQREDDAAQHLIGRRASGPVVRKMLSLRKQLRCVFQPAALR